MDWANGKSNISNLEPGPILDMIMEKKVVFEEMSFVDIYQEFNHKVDHFILEEGCLVIHEIKEHTPTYLIHLQLF
jgi:hypothetical protein